MAANHAQPIGNCCMHPIIYLKRITATVNGLHNVPLHLAQVLSARAAECGQRKWPCPLKRDQQSTKLTYVGLALYGLLPWHYNK